MKLRSILVAAALMTACAALTPGAAAAADRPDPVRFATFNVSLHRDALGKLPLELAEGTDPRARVIAETIQATAPDVILLNEFDYDPQGTAVDAFRTHYLEVSQNGRDPIDYPYVFTAPVNTGVPSGHDLNRDGVVAGPEDAFGFGEFPGQFGMVVLSRYPIDDTAARTFQQFRWQDMPGALLPTDRAGTSWYAAAALADFRLSSKSHWDVPIRIGTETVHVLASHPTPPAFDGPEQRNAKRNHDEIRFWSDYVTPGSGGYLYDDAGVRGGLDPRDAFVILGDLNADPADGNSIPGAVQHLLQNRRIIDPMPASDGAAEAATGHTTSDPEVPPTAHRSDPAYDTADFPDDPGPGNLRVDYVLPSREGLLWTQAGVFWPTSNDVDHNLVASDVSSDHRLVWVDVRVG